MQLQIDLNECLEQIKAEDHQTLLIGSQVWLHCLNVMLIGLLFTKHFNLVHM